MSSLADFLGTANGLGVVVIAGVALILFWEALIVVCVLLATLSDRQLARKRTSRR
jgi:hypothetical protein